MVWTPSWNQESELGTQSSSQLEVFSEDTPRAALWYIYIIVEQSGPKV